MPWSLPSTPGLLAARLGLVALGLAEGQHEKALPPLRFVAQHPGSSQQQRQQATQLLAAMRAPATDDSPWDLTTYVQTILSEGTSVIADLTRPLGRDEFVGNWA